MLEVLAQAQSAGQKAQEDSRRGQGSIFDLGGDADSDESSSASPFAAPRHPQVPAEEFDQNEKLRLEKETLGTFVSDHPLDQVGDALRARVERPLAAVGAMADGAWVTVGGIVAEAKKVRTRRGGYVMFAALDDLEGRLDLFVRDAASEQAEALELDRVVVVRGRIEKGEEGKLSLNVHEAEGFEPGADELARARANAARNEGPMVLNVNAAEFPAGVIEELKTVFETFPGDVEVQLVMTTRAGVRCLKFGDGYRVARSPALRAELDQLLGPAALAA
jgi:DNA polymerase-3 subunit alpha